MSIVFAILLFSFLIFVHELGHFLAAKASGVQVNEFALFMGPAIFKKKVGDTLYSIRCIPIGGYCAMEGEDTDTDNPRSFIKAAWWKRLIILVAGSFMNFVIGVMITVICYLPVQQIVAPVIDSFESFSTVDEAGGLQVGDRILEIDGEPVYMQSDFSLILSMRLGGRIVLLIADGKFDAEAFFITLADTPSNDSFASAMVRNLVGAHNQTAADALLLEEDDNGKKE